MASDGQFTLIVVSAEPSQIDVAAEEFAKRFSLERDVAASILKGAPIVFTTGLSKSEVRAVTPGLQEVSKLGVEFRLTLMTPNKLPRVNWPMRPQFTAAGSGGAHAVSFAWDNNAFVCPGCGETFMFRRLGKLPLTVDAPAPKAAPAAPALSTESKSGLPAATAGVAAAKTETKSKSKAPKVEAPVEELKLDLDAVPDMNLDLGGGEGLDLGSALEEAAAPAKEEKKKKKEPPPEQVETVKAPAVESAPAAEPEISLDDALGDGLLSSEDALKDDAGTPDVAEAPLAPGEEAYNVFVSQIKDKEKRDEVAKIVAEARKCSMDEAKQMTNRAMFKAADGVGKPKADAILAQLKKLKVSARMTKASAGG